MKKKKVIFISSTGGHFSELMVLKPIFDDYDYHLITEKTGSTISLKDEYKDRMHYLVYGTRVHMFRYILKVTYNTIKSLGIFLKVRPKAIVTTGTHTATPMCIIGKLFGTKIIFIETYANVYTPTGTGKFVYKIADEFIVQWEEMLEVYPKARYLGGVF